MNSRFAWKHKLASVIMLLASLLFLDISFARIRYHYRLVNELRPMKVSISTETYQYHGAVEKYLQNCQAYDRVTKEYIHNCSLSACEQNAILLSEKRQSILTEVREYHPSSRLVSEIFDGARGMDQGTKIESLFGRKTCEGVIASSDKTNRYIDMSAMACLPLGVLLLWVCVRLALATRTRHRKVA